MDEAALIISILSFLVASASFYINQKWKKLEFVGQEIRNFRHDYMNQTAMKMLDWNVAKYRHPDIYKDGNPIMVTISDKDILNGLGAINGNNSYTIEEKFVRDCFDNFFDSLEVLETHIEQGLVSFKSYEPYFIYCIHIIMDKNSGRKSSEIQLALLEHMKAFGYDKALSFCNRFSV